MTVLDDRGRVFGRVNLVDALVAGFLLLLIPVAYGTWLLFHPNQVQIASVTRVQLSKEEQRIANPLRAAAKLKVRGSGFTPMLRAWIGSEPALGFTFEDPNSADVIVGPMPPGEYDVALYDGGQEVARAAKAFAIPASRGRPQIKAIGRLVDLDRATADGLQPGAAFPTEADPRVRIAALGPVGPGSYALLVQPGKEAQLERLEVPRDGTFERAAAVVLGCDPAEQPDSGCTIGGVYPAANAQLRVPGAPQPMTFIVDELLPAAPAEMLDVNVRLSGGPATSLMQIGDRDTLLDDRAAVVTALGSRPTGATGGLDVRVRMGVDRAHDGWRYRGRLVKPGAAFSLTTERYVVSGTIASMGAPGTTNGRQ
jgi:hypothetical protein